MRLICGADGCRKGWIAISKDLDSGQISWHLHQSASKLFYKEPLPQVIAIDIPIGLPDHGSRTCDLQARQLLGAGRASSVFPVPLRLVLSAKSYEEACRIRFDIERKKISLQSWGILPKIIDVDSLLRQDTQLQERVWEIHPEVCFYFLAGQRPLRYSKKDKFGYDERFSLLLPFFGDWLKAVLSERQELGSTPDDVLDAFVALWTAERIANGNHHIITSDPPKDTLGLPMRMVA